MQGKLSPFLFFGDDNLVEGDGILLAYKNATHMLPPPCIEVMLWPVCDDDIATT